MNPFFRGGRTRLLKRLFFSVMLLLSVTGARATDSEDMVLKLYVRDADQTNKSGATELSQYTYWGTRPSRTAGYSTAKNKNYKGIVVKASVKDFLKYPQYTNLVIKYEALITAQKYAGTGSYADARWWIQVGNNLQTVNYASRVVGFQNDDSNTWQSTSKSGTWDYNRYAADSRNGWEPSEEVMLVIDVESASKVETRLDLHDNTYIKFEVESGTNYFYYEPNGGSGSEVTDSKGYYATKALKGRTFERPGYVQTSWNTRADGKGTEYQLGQDYSGKMGLKLYAQWTKVLKAVDLGATADIWNQKVQLKWQHESISDNQYTKGHWHIFRMSSSETAYTKLNVLAKGSTSYIDSDVEVGEKYKYAVTFVPDFVEEVSTIEQPEPAELTTTKEVELKKEFNFSNIQTSNTKSGGGGIYFSWKPDKEGVDVLLQRYDSIAGNWNRIIYDGTGTSCTDTDVSTGTRYAYRLKTHLWDKDFYSDTLFITYAIMTEVTKVTASQGYYNNIVKVQWEADQYGTSDTRYVLSRKLLTDKNAVYANIYEVKGTTSSYHFDDTSAQPGQFYYYRVTAYAPKADGSYIQGNSMETDGFNTAKGIMSGRVTFGSGTAVEDVYVRLTKNTDDDDPKPQFYALSSQDATGILTWTPAETTVSNILNGKPMSVQMWVNPDQVAATSGERAFLYIENQLTLYLKDASTAGRYEIVAKLPGKDKVNTGLFVKIEAYTNIILTSDGKGNYDILASNGISGNNQLVLNKATYTAQPIVWKNNGQIRSMKVGGNGNPADVFAGNIDDVRVWSTDLTEAQISKNYNRMLAGTEANLLCYWPLDEGTSGIPYAYDFSKTNGVSNGNHAKLSNSALYSTVVPGVDQLALYGMTDNQGNFTVRGIPFSGEGTSYTVTPVKGTHEFNPAYVSRFVSNNSLTHNAVDFTDVSSFPVSGTVYFSGTTIPVEEAYVYVDGSVASKNGDLIQTDDKGEFSVDVPIGNHYIEIRKAGHTFENNGRYPADPNGTNTATVAFVQPVSGLIFSDETVVAVTGRVAGGDIENAKPLGLGASKANIGQATLTLDYVGSEKYMINARRVTSGLTTYYENNTVRRDFTATTGNVNSVAYVEAGANVITVQTDPKTGEFVAMLPPLKYNVTATQIASQPEISFASNLPSIDASNVMKTYTDSLYDEMSEKYEYFTYAGSAKMRYKSAAKIAVTENADGSFGIDKVPVKNNAGVSDTIALYTVKPDQSIEYTFDYPVYNQLEKYTYKLKAYEEYVNKDNSEEPVTSVVPLEGTTVTIQNQYAAEAYVKTDGTFVKVEDASFELDSLGVGYYRFLAGSPNIQAPYTRGIAISFNVDGTAVQWEHNSDFKAIILGALPTGNNFVTYGPDKVLMILRDPPGTGSSTTYGKGYTHTEASSTTVRASENVGYDMTSKFGIAVHTVTGNLIAGTITNIDSSFDLGFGISEQYDYESNNAVSHTVTVSEEYSTSDGSDFVGSVGDVFIGASTNVVLGTSNDVVVNMDESGDYVLGVKQNMIASQEFKTNFAYTENNIKNILIPNLIDARNNTLMYVDDPEDYPRPAQGEEPIYVTNLTEGEDGYGTPNNDPFWEGDTVSWNSSISDQLFTNGKWGGKSYTIILPQNYQYPTDADGNKLAFTDMIQWYNSSIALWERQLYNNEKAKVDAIIQRDRYFLKNYSFDAGSSISIAVDSVTSYEYTRSDGFDINVAFTEGWSSDIEEGAKVAYEFEMHEEVTSGGTWETSKGDEYETNISYTLAEDGDDDYLSVDVYNAPDGFGPIFVTRGGATCAPYEDEVVTEYYRPGTIISYKTLQIEKPELEIVDQVVTGVPAGKDAQVHIVLRNLSETGEDCYYGLWINPDSNPDGLQIYLDGQPIMSGVDILVPAGEPMYKTLLVRQTNPDILDYENISLSFYSTSQPDDTGVFPGIYSDGSFSIHFQPSVTDIDLAVSRSVVNTNNDQPLTLSVSGYDYNQASFQRIRLQYKGLNDANFVTLKEYVKDPAVAAADVNLDVFTALTGVEKLNLNVDLAASEYLDQTYVFRAVAVGIRNGQEVLNSSQEIQVVRDMSRPQLIANPSPSNGILDASSEIMVTFNEDIRNNILTKPGNFVVTGVMNEAEVSHDVALNLTGTAQAKTQATLELAGNSFAADMWMNYSADGTLFQHGTSGNNFKVAIEGGKLAISVGTDKVVSSESLPKNQWLFLTFNYDADTDQPVVNASYALDADIVTLLYQQEIHVYEGNGPVALGGNGLTARIHEVSLWDKARSMIDALTDRSRTKNPYTSGLIGYWQFNEGHGTAAEDRSRSRHFTLPTENAWYLNAGTNYVVSLNGSTALFVPSSVSTRSDESYLVETWFKAEASTGKSTILSTPNGIDIAIDGNNLEVTFKQNSPASIALGADLKDGQWHHLALNVLRSTGGAATLYIDGQARRTFAASSVPILVEGIFTLGGRYWGTGADYKLEHFMKGSVDELRIWKGRYTKDFIESRMYERVDTIQGHGNSGLAAYYPFESRSLDSYGQVSTSPSAVDIVGVGLDATLRMVGNGAGPSITFAENGPSLKTAPARENVQFDFVASERQIRIELLEEPYRIENCNVFLTLKDVKDVNGNSSQPISWVIYAQQNQLKWSESEVELEVKNGETESFTVEISNEGNTTDNWVISNLPSWLSVNAESGTLAPQATKKLIFSVEEGTAIGIYEAAIGLTGNQNIEAQLNVALRVKGEAPDWTPVIGEEAMIVVGQLSVDGIVSCDTEDMVAAFDGLKCVGMAHPVYVSRYDSYVLTMTIYGDGATETSAGSEGKALTYKAYDASTGVIYPFISSSKEEAFTFNACKVVGSFGDMAIFTPQNKIEQAISLNRGGWKWFSMYVTTDADNSVASVFSHTDKVSVVKNASLHTDYYNGSWYGDLTRLEVGKMYKLNATSAFDEVATGAPSTAESVQISLNGHGWSWIGYPLQYTNTLATALADANPQDGDVIMGQSAFAMYMDGNWSGSLCAVTPGEGYKYYSTADAKTFHFQKPASSSSSRVHGLHRSDILDLSYPENMAMIAVVKKDGQIIDASDVTIAIYVGNELRGFSANADAEGRHFVTVGGYTGAQQMKAIVSTADGCYTLAEVETYAADRILGTVAQPFVIDLNGATAIENIYEGAESVELYDMNGRRCDSCEDVFIEKITYEDGQVVIRKKVEE